MDFFRMRFLAAGACVALGSLGLGGCGGSGEPLVGERAFTPYVGAVLGSAAGPAVTDADRAAMVKFVADFAAGHGFEEAKGVDGKGHGLYRSTDLKRELFMTVDETASDLRVLLQVGHPGVTMTSARKAVQDALEAELKKTFGARCHPGDDRTAVSVVH